MRILIWTFMSLTVGIMSCSPTAYAPSLQHVPNLRAQGDVEVQGGILTTENTEGGGGAIAVAVTDRDGVGFNLNILSGTDDDEADGSISTFELYYIRQGLVSENKKFMWGLAPGLGYSGMNWDTNSLGRFKSGYLQPFVQPSVGFVTPYFEAMVSARVTYVAYLNNSFNSLSVLVSDQFQDRGNQFTFEPALTLRAGWKYVRIQTQLVYSTFNAEFGQIDNNINSFIDAEKSLFNFGLQFYLPHNSN